ncbi:hypothetical protein F8M41_003884 [Gigaspora margarita]|uniref:Uncharacterized protein n=1 Tax=Gigaspora margarita TaxID=4874 RepID=A0A8H4AXT3_GIGMA|nr:hypothetical protein F8M41_003884 [Gigaspora margarita]
MQKVSKYFKVLKKYFTSFHSAIAEVGSPTSTAIAKPSYTSEEFLMSSEDQRFDQLMEKIKGIDECLKEVEDM